MAGTTIDLDDLEHRIREACEVMGDPVRHIDRSLDYLLDVYGGDNRWSLQVGNPHAANGQPDLILPARRQFFGRLTPGAWAALDAVKRSLHTLPHMGIYDDLG